MIHGETRTNDRLPHVAGLIFDLDGTLVDSFADIATALNLTRRDFGLPPLPGAEVRREVGSGSEYLVRRLVTTADGLVADALARYLAHYAAHVLDETHLYPGVPAVLDRFADRRLAVVSNKPQHLSERVLEGLGVRERFAVVLGGDALPRRKPDPLPILTALDRLGLRPAAAALVGDGLNDIASGRAAGIRTVAVASGVESRAALAAQGPDFLIDRVEELLELFA